MRHQTDSDKVENLGFGEKLITSATTAYNLFESEIESTTTSGVEKLPWCQISIVTLEYGKQLVEPNIKIPSDLATFEQFPATKINVRLPHPISNLLSELPELEDMPYYDSKTDVEIVLSKEVKKKVFKILDVQNQEKRRKIEKPLAPNMRKFIPSLSTRVFDDRLTLKHSLIMNINSFIRSMVLHALLIWVYHKRKKEKLEPSRFWHLHWLKRQLWIQWTPQLHFKKHWTTRIE